jgi:hypothetical protein
MTHPDVQCYELEKGWGRGCHRPKLEICLNRWEVVTIIWGGGGGYYETLPVAGCLLGKSTGLSRRIATAGCGRGRHRVSGYGASFEHAVRYSVTRGRAMVSGG